MVLVDTSIWVSHLRSADHQLKKLLFDGEVACHPFIIGELSCGTFPHKQEIIQLLHALPQTQLAAHEEILDFIAAKHLSGLGIGLIDVHLLASALLSKAFLWTLDRNLQLAAQKVHVLYKL